MNEMSVVDDVQAVFRGLEKGNLNNAC